MGSFSLQQHLGGRHDRSVWLCLAFVLSVAAIPADAEAKGTSLRDLRASLFEHYDKLVRPVVNQKTTTEVYVGMTPLALTDLDEEKQIIELDTWIVMRWKDEYLVWDPEDYGGITAFNIPSTEIWRPDITVYSGTPAKKLVIEVLTNAIVNYTGDVLWVPPVSIRSRCPQEIETYPRDTHTCVIRIGSWTYHEYVLNLQHNDEPVKTDYFKNTHPKWEFLSLISERRSKHYSCCKEPYPEIDYTITFKRRAAGRASPCPAEHMHDHCSFMRKSASDTCH